MMADNSPKADKRLLGTWRSDRGRTVSEWRFSKRLTPLQRRKFLAIFGKLQLTYTRTHIRGVLREYRFAQPYELLGTDADTVAIRYHDKQLTGEWCIQHIHFEGNHYWVAFGRNREWFKRVIKRAT